jgi:hypothetical protein
VLLDGAGYVSFFLGSCHRFPSCGVEDLKVDRRDARPPLLNPTEKRDQPAHDPFLTLLQFQAKEKDGFEG